MSKATGYALWLVPDRKTNLYKILRSLIIETANQYNAPTFDPHVTLLGGLKDTEEQLQSRARKLANALTPYEIELGKLGSHKTYFRILFSAIKQTEVVMQANVLAQEIFAVNKEGYFPHLSLVYGNLSQKEVAYLQEQLQWQFNSFGTNNKFLVHCIELWHTEGVVENWYRAEMFPLIGNPDTVSQ